jgi:hypothetical protein
VAKRRVVRLRVVHGASDKEKRRLARNWKISQALMGNQNGRGNRRRVAREMARPKRVGDDLTRCFMAFWDGQGELEIAFGERLAEAFVTLVSNVEKDQQLLELLVAADDALSDLLSAIWKRRAGTGPEEAVPQPEKPE